jgi:hypothetical protein
VLVKNSLITPDFFMATDKHIPGIYNWCDKWCEKCSFTSRCRLFADESKWYDEDEDPEAEGFWDSEDDEGDSGSFQGFDEEEYFEAPEISDEEREAFRQEREIQELMVESHPLSEMGDRYMKQVKEWLDAQLASGLWDKAKKENPVLFTPLEIISYDFTFIPVKCSRALRDFQMRDDFDRELPEEEKFHNGSAKVASLSVRRSLAAWGKLTELLPEQQHRIRPFQELLEKISEGLDAAFPNAESFIRPGFDD